MKYIFRIGGKVQPLFLTLLFSLFLFNKASFSQSQNSEIKPLTIDDGLLSEGIRAICKDRDGFIWLGGQDGLSCFDGYGFKLYKSEFNNPSSLSNSQVLSLIRDKNGDLWVATFRGLNRYCRESNSFKQFFYNKTNPASLCNDYVTHLYLDRDSDLWVGTINGLCKYNYMNESFVRFDFMPNHAGSGKNNDINDIVEDSKGNLWIASWQGWLSRLDKNSGVYTTFRYPLQNKPDNVAVSSINRLYIDDKDVIWLMYNNNLEAKFDTRTLLFSFDLSEFNQYTKFASSKVYWETIDDNGRFWFFDGQYIYNYSRKEKNLLKFKFDSNLNIADYINAPHFIYNDGLDNYWLINSVFVCHKLNKTGKKFSQYYTTFSTNHTKTQDYVRAFCKDRYNQTWFGTFGNGLLVKEDNSADYKRLSEIDGLANNHVTSLIVDKFNQLWVGTNNGISILDTRTKRVIRQLKNDKNNTNSLNDNAVRLLFQDSQNNIWIATTESLDLLNTQTETFTHFTRGELNGLSHYTITDIYEDTDKEIWIGTIDGLNKYNYKTGTFQVFTSSNDINKGLTDSYITMGGICQSKDGVFWFATREGINSYDKKTNKFNTHIEQLNLLSDKYFNLTIDKENNLWMISEKGITKFLINKNEIRDFEKSYGIEVNVESIYFSSDGCLFIGGKKSGYYSFYPDQLIESTFEPPIFITQFNLFNQQVALEDNVRLQLLHGNIISNKKITLKHTQSFFTIEFVALDYTNPDNIKYAYRLNGVDEKWIHTEANRRYATYTYLKPGKYLFEVKATNSDGVWSAGQASKQIEILPPFWRTGVAYIIYTVILGLLLFGIRTYSVHRVNAWHSIKLDKLKSDKEAEISQLKLRFITNISHEFRTPLTLISGPLDKLTELAQTKGWSNEADNYFSLIRRNVARLKELTNQLLDIRKLETGKLKLELSKGDIIQFLASIAGNFETVAEKKNINYTFHAHINELITWFDADKVDKIVTNIVSNAFKYTNPAGSIHFDIEQISELSGEKHVNKIKISISDTGIGIPEKSLASIFERFYQADNSNTRKIERSGVGLDLTRELVLMHQGEISVESIPDKGSCFTIKLPLDIDYMNNYSIIEQTIDMASFKNENQVDLLISDNKFPEPITDQNQVDNTESSVLVVEDNPDLLSFITGILAEKYSVVTAVNGQEGLARAVEYSPSIIISDIMMPIMDGIEMTKLLKNDIRTSHIPVILLTALSSIERKMEGFNTGADDYLTKPFNHELLLTRVNNLLLTRLKLQDYFLGTVKSGNPKSNIQPGEIEVVGVDERFLSKLIQIVEKRIPDPNFDVEILASELGMVSRVLYRKLKALINQTPSGFIFDMRMKRAAQVLLQNKVPVSEVADMVGFNDRKYFSICFRKYYGVSPTEYLKTI